MTKELKTSEISIETRDMLLHDMFSDVSLLLDKSESKIRKLVEMLIEQKDAVGHGKWLAYLRESFGGDAAVKRVQYYMRKVDKANSRIFNYLEDGESEPETAPRSERKPANVTITTPVDHSGDADDMVDKAVDDDPTPDPPTQRKTAKGSEKVSEDKKPRTAAITPEILPDEPDYRLPEEKTLAAFSFSEIIQFISDSAAGDEKTVAKKLRKLADKLDPPDETKASKIPTISELKTLIDKTELSDQMPAAVTDWLQYKQKHPDKKYRYQSGESFVRDQKRMVKVYMAKGEPFVLEAIDTAIAKGWRGWEQDSNSNGSNGNGKAQHNGRGRGLTADEVFS